jgi:superfamily I DNA and/or RNA helicase
MLKKYKKQQRAIQSKLLISLSLKNIPVMTIDQCQGQEADIVFISLVSKPTKFLNKNRLNVAMSRMREKLYLLADEVGFRRACEDLTWDASFLAKRILTLKEQKV